jgi:NAD(P)H-nitrite reductase large subunit
MGVNGSKSRLTVIGNGMAGARTVAEIFARGSADQFEITVFGEEPYRITTESCYRMFSNARRIRTTSLLVWIGTKKMASAC